MRRRRPSALYSVLDEEQLLGGVDLTDYPDPTTADVAAEPSDDHDRSRAWSGAAYHQGAADEWSPDDPTGDGDWSFDGANGYRDWSPGGVVDQVESGADRPTDRPPSTSLRSAVDGGRRRRLVIGFAAALIVVLLVARGLSGILAGAGARSDSGRTGARAMAGALSAMSGSAGGVRARQPIPGAAPVSVGTSSGARHAPATGTPASRPRGRHPRIARTTKRGPRATRADDGGDRGPARPSRRAVGGGRTATRPVAARLTPFDTARPGTAPASARPARIASPEQEFGFER
jgi:hypothetical protein